MYDTWLLEVIALESIRVERCRSQERVIVKIASVEPTKVGTTISVKPPPNWPRKSAKIPTAPIKTRAKTVAGRDHSAKSLEWVGKSSRKRRLDRAQEVLAHDLLGTPFAFRMGAGSPLSPEPAEDIMAHRLVVREHTNRGVTISDCGTYFPIKK